MMNAEMQRNQRQSVKEARFSMYLIKNQQVKNLKHDMQNEKQRYANEMANLTAKMMDRKMQIHSQRENAKAAVTMFKWGKFNDVQTDFRARAQKEKELILEYQEEARELERMEAELIARLHNTQAMERAAFLELEKAMISASQPKKERIMIIEEMTEVPTLEKEEESIT
jgi:hypothetical protein